MKRQRTRKEKLSNPIDIAEDRISHLPEDIIVKILSTLPIKTVIKTSILSKRWKNLWKRLEDLKFDSRDHKNNFAEDVSNALLSHQNPAFQSLTIASWKRCKTTDLARWISIALSKHATKLVLKLHEVPFVVPLPSTIPIHSNKLKILKIMGNMSFRLSLNSVDLICLKELHLYNVKFENEESVSHLLKGCPVLEDLIVDIYISSGVKTLRINTPSLKKVILGSYYCKEENIVIETPNLAYLDIHRFDGIRACVINHSPEVEVARILDVRPYMDEDILASITSVQRLTLCSSIKFHSGKTFYQLTTLKLDTQTDIWCNLLFFMFSVSPKLESLTLFGGTFGRWAPKWIQPQCSADSLKNQLHTLAWEGFIYDAKDDKDVAIYILKNAGQLEKATFITLDPLDTTMSRQREETLCELSNVDRASPRCDLVFEESRHWNARLSDDIDTDVQGFYY